MDKLYNITPIDGRYSEKITNLNNYFSEFALIRYRLEIELDYLIMLMKKIGNINESEITHIYSIINYFDIDEAMKIKNIEEKINHDVKSIEYYIKHKLIKIEEKDLSFNKNIKLYIHFGLTSQDINSSANILMIKNFNEEKLIHILKNINLQITLMAETWKDVLIMSRTHGQPATPTYLGKEFLVYVERLENQIKMLEEINYRTKFGGATGGLNAHYYAYPQIDWINFSNEFVKSLNLERNQFTTQIDHYDNYSEIFDILKRINTIFIDFCQDIWLYISFDYFKLKLNNNEVGSSTMPHKINPINFENAEGNLYLSNTLFNLFSNKLPISRLQRDLTDSTILRNLGTAYGYMAIALNSIDKGIGKLEINMDKIQEDLQKNYMIISEGLQTKLKVYGIDNSYELLKEYTRINDTNNIKEKFENMINRLDLTEQQRNELLALYPNNYKAYY